MKNVLFAAIATVAMIATPAAAADYDINLGVNAIVQDQNGNVAQTAMSAAAAVGETGTNVDISSTAVTAAQLANLDVTTLQGNGGVVNGNGALNGTLQTLDGSVTQVAASLAGSGDLGNGSSITSTAAALGQSSSVSVRVNQ